MLVTKLKLNKLAKGEGLRVILVLFFCLFLSPALAANSRPKAVALTPASGKSNPYQTIALKATYSDANGWQNINNAYLLINERINGKNCLNAFYNRASNRIYLRKSADNGWTGGFAPGSDKVIENNQVRIYCAKTTVSGSGNKLVVRWAVAFKTSFAGVKNAYLNVSDMSGATSGWLLKGNWTINPNLPPAVGSISPAGGTYASETENNFTTTYSDPNTFEDIQSAFLIINTSTSGAKCVYGYYDQNNDKLYLRNDVNTSWLGGYAAGSPNIIENSYAKLDCSRAVVINQRNAITITWPLTFKSTFSGAKNMYLYVRDDSKAHKGWKAKGKIIIQDQPIDNLPPAGTIRINEEAQYTGSGSVTLNLSAQDELSGSGLSQMQFSNDNISWSTPEAYASSKAWALGSGEGTKTVYVKYKDLAGNWSQPYSNSITLDTTPPSIAMSPASNATNQDVRLAYFVSDNFTSAEDIKITGDNSPYTAEGVHNVTLVARDLAGNTARESVSLTIDKTAPKIVITSPQNGAVAEEPQIQLTGTVDGTAFSENRSLNEGENTLTKTATDAAGNTASASVSVYLHSGELIGPDGGTAVSEDGKVKIVIPQGALTAPARIRVSKVAGDILKNLAPEGKTLLSAVECKPLGLNFITPASIIYTLDEAQIPGTSVSLGLYDDGKIYLTSEPSVVPVDGYTVTFKIRHFSTYTALGSFITQGAAIGSGVKIPLPDLLTGSFSHSIPITLPPGRKGMQPQIALNYRSSNANSWVGLGFNLNPGYIVRSTRLGPPAYDDKKDTFYLFTDAGTTELVNLVDNLYQAKVESGFTKFFKEADDSWRALSKDGAVLRFGQTSGAKETSPQGTFSWYLTKAIDTNGNYISYNYLQDQGKSYLSNIDYTGNENGTSPANSVEFSLEARDDILSSYISSAKIVTAKRLKEIRAKAGEDLAWRYELEYIYSPDTNRSILKSVTQYASDDKSLPKQILSYQQSK